MADLSHVQRVLSAGDGSGPAMSAVEASWRRCMTVYGLDPDAPRPTTFLGEAEFRRACERAGPLLQAAEANLDRLFLAVGDAGCCVMLTDAQGVPLARRGTDADDADFRRWGLWTGADWSEAAEGTNGIGTCLAEERALTIHRDQHFHSGHTALSCSAAPIYDHRGELLAALDVSSCRRDLSEAFAGLISTTVVEAARRIEAQVFTQAFERARIVLAGEADRGPASLLAVDRDDLVVGATRAARQRYGITDARIQAGLTADDVLNPDGPGPHLIDGERAVVQQAMARAGGKVAAAARLLGVSRATLHRKLDRLGLSRRH